MHIDHYKGSNRENLSISLSPSGEILKQQQSSTVERPLIVASL